jgi:hypothetical protein
MFRSLSDPLLLVLLGLGIMYEPPDGQVLSVCVWEELTKRVADPATAIQGAFGAIRAGRELEAIPLPIRHILTTRDPCCASLSIVVLSCRSDSYTNPKLRLSYLMEFAIVRLVPESGKATPPGHF